MSTADKVAPVPTRSLRIAWLGVGPAARESGGVPGVAAELLHGLAGLGHRIDCFSSGSAHELPPRLAGYFHFYSAAGVHAFGDPQAARDEYRRALGIATRAHLAPLVHDATAALRQLDAAGPAPAAREAREPSSEVAGIAEALARMCERTLPLRVPLAPSDARPAPVSDAPC